MDTNEAVNAVIALGVHGNDLMELALRFGINLFVIIVIVRVIYYTRHRNKDFVFTFILFNVINFLLCFFLSSAKLKMGFAFGLFAIFSILRYRTVTVPVREMGYFFISVTIGILNALMSSEQYMVQLLIANSIILTLTYILDHRISLKHENFKEIVYERIDLIHPDKREEMLADLNKRTGLGIHRIELLKIDFLKDVALIHGFYFSANNDTPSAIKTNDNDDD
ncbi:MAG TPA: DUF4956 domain-containing protein [Candidatus Kapabacteria bacterium]|nr:DUF4956 domain-containing protein [Candidatus Kapabacteria bacterium]